MCSEKIPTRPLLLNPSVEILIVGLDQKTLALTRGAKSGQ